MMFRFNNSNNNCFWTDQGLCRA